MLEYASDEIKNDPIVMLFAVKIYDMHLKWASASIKNNKKIID